ncbi:MAG: hypothetical protein K0U78_16370 [Actinomycetia bacterium]|nr:hypothetical protein [Actinomycetes bacterium]
MKRNPVAAYFSALWARRREVEAPEDSMHAVEVKWNAGAASGIMGTPTGGCDNTFFNPMCFKNGQPICDMRKTAGAANAQAGAVAYTINISPARFMYFEALACRMRVVSDVDANLALESRVTAVVVNNSAREDVDDRAPTAATLTYIPTSFFEAPDTYAVAVPWGAFGRNTTPYQLQIICFSPQAAATTIDHVVVIFGNPLPKNSKKVTELETTTP